MPLRTSAKKHSQSPTPLIKGRNPDPERPDEYHFQLERIRRGGAVHIVFAQTSPTAPGRTIAVRNGKVGFLPLIAAAEALIAASHWDPTTQREYAKPRWNKDSARYAERHENAETVICQLDRLLNPRKGRPSTVEAYRRTRALADREGVMLSASTQVARSNRRGELLQMAARVRAALGLPLERFAPDRTVVMGFTKPETDTVRDGLRAIEIALQDLTLRVETNNLLGAVNPPALPGRPFLNRANLKEAYDVPGGFKRRVPPVSGGLPGLAEIEKEMEQHVMFWRMNPDEAIEWQEKRRAEQEELAKSAVVGDGGDGEGMRLIAVGPNERLAAAAARAMKEAEDRKILDQQFENLANMTEKEFMQRTDER